MLKLTSARMVPALFLQPFLLGLPFWHHGLWYQFKCIQNSKLQEHSALTGQVLLTRGQQLGDKIFPFLPPDTLPKTWLDGFSESQDRALGSYQFSPPSSVCPHPLLLQCIIPHSSPLMKRSQGNPDLRPHGNAGQVNHTPLWAMSRTPFLSYRFIHISRSSDSFNRIPLLYRK